jgi:MFS superfamily sulfate permease-like transporter
LIFKKDNLKLGILLGVLAPFLAMILYYLWNFSRTFSFGEYFYVLHTNKPLLTAISSISLLANAILFTVYINTQRDQTAKGIFVATLIYGIAVLIYKLIH